MTVAAVFHGVINLCSQCSKPLSSWTNADSVGVETVRCSQNQLNGICVGMIRRCLHQKRTWFGISNFGLNELLCFPIFISEHEINFMIRCRTHVMKLQA